MLGCCHGVEAALFSFGLEYYASLFQYPRSRCAHGESVAGRAVVRCSAFQRLRWACVPSVAPPRQRVISSHSVRLLNERRRPCNETWSTPATVQAFARFFCRGRVSASSPAPANTHSPRLGQGGYQVVNVPGQRYHALAFYLVVNGQATPCHVYIFPAQRQQFAPDQSLKNIKR